MLGRYQDPPVAAVMQERTIVRVHGKPSGCVFAVLYVLSGVEVTPSSGRRAYTHHIVESYRGSDCLRRQNLYLDTMPIVTCPDGVSEGDGLEPIH